MFSVTCIKKLRGHGFTVALIHSLRLQDKIIIMNQVIHTAGFQSQMETLNCRRALPK